MSEVRRLALKLGLAGLAAVGYGGLVERRAYRLRQVTVPLLAPRQRAWRLLHLSDLHLTRQDARLVEWLRRLGDLRPDLVVTTGDNLAEAEAIPCLARALEPLFDRPGLFVFGSNDYCRARFKFPWSYFLGSDNRPVVEPTLPTAALSELLTSVGWRSVEQQHFTMEVAGQVVDVRGTGDAHIGWDDYTAVAGPVDPAASLALGLTHSPYRRLLDAMTADGVGLILAGHTHGGQVCLPGYGALTTNCDLDRHRAKGLSWWETGDRTAALHVSAGLGTSPYAPYRFACPPEASLLTLVPRAGL
ncbi:MAG: metallophosphoesterase [Propionibacteriaceae bacterium]|jgi:predicted MPP superfamily phosphohydrolase|nr:metallophosphoesterase [Propionibacteriaceae bacterium]